MILKMKAEVGMDTLKFAGADFRVPRVVFIYFFYEEVRCESDIHEQRFS